MYGVVLGLAWLELGVCCGFFAPMLNFFPKLSFSPYSLFFL